MIGKTISHYRILAELGRGGMGVVYKAEDTKLKRTVALKFLPPELMRDPEAKQRFIHEAQAASALEHNHICNIHEVDEIQTEGNDLIFITMACYDGESLKNHIQRGPLKLETAIQIVCEIADGLHEAHQKEIVHRDIKPANIMITARGTVKIMDFGLAKLRGQTKLTKSGTTLGTVAYMSPEQARNQDVDHRTDIWSLGVILYELVTGQLPFQGDYEQAVLYSILSEEPEPLTGLRSGVPLALELIVTKALQKDPQHRYQHVDEMLVDLKNLENQRLSSTTALKQIPPSNLKKWVLLGSILGAFAIGLVFVFNGLPILKRQPDKRPMIVVLPFENLGPAEHTYFADGMTEEITSRLAAYPELGVISRTSAYQYKDANMPVKKIGQELGVDFVLEGTVRWDQSEGFRGRVRVTPQLIRVSDDTHLWSNQFDRVLQDIFLVQSEIAEQVIQQMNIRLLDQGKKGPAYPTENMEAYQAYLRGLDFTGRKAYSMEDRLLQIQMLERAVSLDSNFTLAYVQLSMAHSRLVMYGLDTSPQRIQMAKQALDKVFALDTQLPEAYMANGYYYYWCFRDYENALKAFKTAEEKLPNDNRLLEAIGYIKRRQGEWEASLKDLEKAFALDPKSSALAREIGVNLANMRNYQKSLTYFDQSIALAPDQQASYVFKALAYWYGSGDVRSARHSLEAMPQVKNWFNYYFWIIHEIYEKNYQRALDLLNETTADVFAGPSEYRPKSMYFGLVYWCMRDTVRSRRAYEQARSMLEEKVKELPDDFRMHTALGKVYAQLGFKERAIQEAEHAVALLPIDKDAMHGPTMVGNLIEVYILTGEIEKAFDELEVLLETANPLSPVFFYLDPVLAQITDHVRFKKLENQFRK